MCSINDWQRQVKKDLLLLQNSNAVSCADHFMCLEVEFTQGLPFLSAVCMCVLLLLQNSSAVSYADHFLCMEVESHKALSPYKGLRYLSAMYVK